MYVKEFLHFCLQISPMHFQETWDNSGAQIIFPDVIVKKVLIATDFTSKTLKAAILKNCQVIVVHHPPIFKPLKSLDFSNPFHQILMQAIQHQISIIALHTNFDATASGMNEYLLKLLGIKKTAPFLMQAGNYSKLIIFTPKAHTEIVRRAICDAGAGYIGNYSDCTFKSNGTGTFKGQKNTNPFLGKPEILESAEEDKLETIINNIDKNKIIKALLSSHPYEEVAYDLIPLSNEKPGLGRIGYLDKKLTSKNFIKLLKSKLNIKEIRFSKSSKSIQKIALITGGAGAFYQEAIKAKCDAYISGDIKHNQWIEANELNLLLIDASHFGTEKFFAACLIQNLKILQIKGMPTLSEMAEEKLPFETL